LPQLRAALERPTSPTAIRGLDRLARHADGFLAAMPRLATRRVEPVAIAPTLMPEQRASIPAAGCLAQDLGDLTAGR
jgi:hypothetical protein